MIPLIRTLSAPLLSLVFMMAASGLFNTFVSLRVELEGAGAEEIGMVTSALYVGIFLGSIRLDCWISKVGHTRAFITLTAALTILVLAQALWIHFWYWSILRIIGGICTAGIFIVIESWLLMQSGPSMRSAALSLYLAVFYAALSGGQLLIGISDPAGFAPFGITAAFLACSLIPIGLYRKNPSKTEATSERLTFKQLIRLSPLSFSGGVVSGMMLAAIYSFLPLYAKNIGMNLSQIGAFMAALIFGGFTLQWPFGKWADQGNRRQVLVIACFATAAIALTMALLSLPFFFLFVLATLLGAFSFTIYPLSMAYACEKVKESEIVAVTGGFILSYSIGAIAGPLLAPIIIDQVGAEGIFYFLASISLLLGIAGLKKSKSPIIEE